MITQQEKTIGLISYLTFVGMIIAYFMNKDLKSTYATYHIKTMFGLVILLFISVVTQGNIHLVTGEIIFVIAFVLWAIAIFHALQGKVVVFPYFSEKFQQWFTFLD
ncbi:MAG: hypothetical protein H0X63_03350 [Flavobacteriales bacterium]|jgi:uncharacterized membrane protein|nr:hypothetical protein [Flavobacteriales bacterium]